MEPVFVKVPVLGSYRSAVGVSEQKSSSHPLNPPATSTCPFASSVAVWNSLFACMEPVFVHVPDAGS